MVSKPDKVDSKQYHQVDIYYNTICLRAAPEPEPLEQKYMITKPKKIS